jgi:hypothetical protein
MKFQAGALLAAAILFASVAPLQATTITSTSISSWMSNISSGSAKDANFSTIQSITYGPSGYTTSDGFTITGPDGAGTFLQGLSYSGMPSLKGGSDGAAQIKVTLPGTGKTGLLFMLASTPAATGYTVTLSDGQVFNLAANTTIFGLSISHPITYVTLAASPGSSLILQDVSYGNTTLSLDPVDEGGSGGTQGGGSPDPGAVPEATTMLLLGTGLVAVAFARKRVISA